MSMRFLPQGSVCRHVVAAAAGLFTLVGTLVLAPKVHGQDLLAGTPTASSVATSTSTKPVWMATDLDLPGLTGGIVVWLDVPANHREAFALDLPTQHRGTVTLFVEPNSVQDPEFFQVREVFGPGEGDWRIANLGQEVTYAGSVPDAAGSDVRLSITSDGLLGGVFFDNGERLYVQPLRDLLPGAPLGLHVVYGGDETSCHGICGVPDALHGTHTHEHLEDGGPFQPRGGCGGSTECIAQVAIEADFLYYQARGSSTSATRDRITAIMNVINHQYQRDVDITHAITFIIIRTTSAAERYTTDVADILLTQFTNEWNTAGYIGFFRDTAHLFTGRELDGNTIGFASVGEVCSITTAYGLSQSDYSSTFACQTDITAHELGHNWGANHCTCTSSTMNPNITCRNTFQNSTSPNSINVITAYRNAQSCFTASPVPPSNNMCSSATRVRLDGNFTGNNTSATTDGGRMLCGSEGSGTKDVWWVVTSPATGLMTINTCGSNFDTILGVYDDCPGGIDDTIACNDNNPSVCGSGAVTSAVGFTAQQGVTYYIRVSGNNGDTGNITLNVNAPNTPSANGCAAATPLVDGVNIGSFYGTGTDGSSSCTSSGNNPDVWYQLTATCSGTLFLDTCGTRDWNDVNNSGPDTLLSVHSGCPGTASNEIECRADTVVGSCPGQDFAPIFDTRVAVNMTRGQTYYIRVTTQLGEWGNGMFRLGANISYSQTEVPFITPIGTQSSPCVASYSGPVPTLMVPLCTTAPTWSLVAGPAGMTINSTTGQVSWANPVVGTHNITIRSTNNWGTDDEFFPLVIQPIAPVINDIPNLTISCPGGYSGPLPTLQIPCMGPVTYSFISNPSGMVINANSGLVTWPNPSQGVHTVTIRATNSAGFDDESWTLTFNRAAPQIADINGQAATAGVAWSLGSPLSNAPCASPATWSILSAPSGFSILPATGLMTWANPTPGTFNVTIRATNTAGFDDESFPLVVSGNSNCDSLDFNRDGLTPDSGDLDDFIAVLAGGPSACSTFPFPGCNDLDFNNDGFSPDSLDLDAFISRLGGGPCLQ